MPARAELHFHVLPAVDDGPATEGEALELAGAAARDGTATVVATPHVHDVQVAELPERVAELQGALRREGVPIQLRCGGELAYDDLGALEQEELETIALGPAGRRWLLLEAPFRGQADDVHGAADELRSRGFGVVVAHPERSAAFLPPGGEGALRTELAKGSRLQVNAGSLLGWYGADVEDRARRLLARGLVHAIASDAHSLARPPCLSDAFARTAAKSEALARRLIDEAPSRLLADGLSRA